MNSSPRRPLGENAASRDRAAVERNWVAQIRAGDRAAFEAMFRAYYDPLCRSIANYLGSREAAEDVVQGVFARIWRGRANWAVTNVQHYLYSAVRRRAASEFRHVTVQRRAAPYLTYSAHSRAEATAADAELEAEELRNRLARALEALPPRTREAFILSRAEGLSYDQVALRMNISIKTVGVHVSNALALLRKTVLAVASAGLALPHH